MGELAYERFAANESAESVDSDSDGLPDNLKSGSPSRSESLAASAVADGTSNDVNDGLEGLWAGAPDVKPGDPGLHVDDSQDAATSQSARSESPWEIDCIGCGVIGDGRDGVTFTGGSDSSLGTIQCDGCRRWSHGDCMVEQFALDAKLHCNDNDVSWSCPVCRGLSVWSDDDKLYVLFSMFCF